jgi:hypothetical protein
MALPVLRSDSRDDFVDPYFSRAKARFRRRYPQGARAGAHHDGHRRPRGEPMASADREPLGHSIQFLHQHRRWGRMFVRICPYFPFSARVCLNQHHLLANRMRQEGIDFKQCAFAFLRCAAPARLLGARRRTYPVGSIDLRPKVARPPHPILYRGRTPASPSHRPPIATMTRAGASGAATASSASTRPRHRPRRTSGRPPRRRQLSKEVRPALPGSLDRCL